MRAQPQRLPARPISHYYRGGANIAKLRHITLENDHQPEEWIGSTVARFDDEVTGQSVLEDGTFLRDAVAANPTAWTGQKHTGSDVGVLVKLLDAAQRLPVHVHPDRQFAASHLDCPYGKSEAWYVLAAEPGSAVYVGWRDDVDPEELASKRDEQDSEWLLTRMNRIEAKPGMGVFVPAGTVHAIGAGVFVLEVQEPTDFSILLEWSVTTSSRDESHLDLGFDQAMGAVSHRATSQAELGRITTHNARLTDTGSQSLYATEADDFFVLRELYAAHGDRVSAGTAAYSVVVIEGGSGLLESVDRESEHPAVQVTAGEAWVVPYEFGEFTLIAEDDADIRALVATAGSTWPPQN
ncbi:MAG: class I mannose-6-phosphate isomerase [Canibacter sp.]